jgi:hypothetical protein
MVICSIELGGELAYVVYEVVPLSKEEKIFKASVRIPESRHGYEELFTEYGTDELELASIVVEKYYQLEGEGWQDL